MERRHGGESGNMGSGQGCRMAVIGPWSEAKGCVCQIIGLSFPLSMLLQICASVTPWIADGLGIEEVINPDLVVHIIGNRIFEARG